MAKSYELDMTKGSILKNVILYSIPLMLSSILQILYNAADIVVLGRFAGSGALASVGATSSVINLMVNLFIGMALGTSVTIAKAFGAKDYKKGQKLLHTSIALSVLFGVISMLMGVVFSRPALTLMGTPKEIIDNSVLYMRLYFLGVPASMIYNFGAMAIRAVGDSKRPLMFLTVSGIVNVILNLIFVILFKMDVAGVATATVISQYVSAILVLLALIDMKGFCHLDIRKITLHKEEAGEILKIGIPAGVQSVVFSISNVLVQSSVNSFGPVTVAASSTASNIENFVYVAVNSGYHTAVTMTGQNVGAKKVDRVGKGILTCALFAVVMGLIVGGVTAIFSEKLMSIYTTDAEVIAIGAKRLRLLSVAYILCGLMDTFVGGIRGLGNSVIPMIVAMSGVCGIRIMWIFTVFKAFHSFTVLLWAYPVSWAVTGLIQLICFLMYKNRVKKRMCEQEAGK